MSDRYSTPNPRDPRRPGPGHAPRPGQGAGPGPYGRDPRGYPPRAQDPRQMPPRGPGQQPGLRPPPRPAPRPAPGPGPAPRPGFGTPPPGYAHPQQPQAQQPAQPQHGYGGGPVYQQQPAFFDGGGFPDQEPYAESEPPKRKRRFGGCLAVLVALAVVLGGFYVAGDRDLVLTFRRMEQLLPALKMFVPQLRETIILPGCGHWTQQERAQEVNAAMLSFLQSLR